LLGEIVRVLPEDEGLVERVPIDQVTAPASPEEKPVRRGKREVDAAERERERWAAERDELRRRAGRERDIETASSRERAQGAFAAQRCWREVPFVLSRDGVGGNGAAAGADPFTGPLTTGRVDLVYQDGEELVVVDYKTDTDVTKDTAEDYAREHHSGQSEVYA